MTIKGHVVPVGGPRSKRAFDLPEKSPQEVKRAGRILAALKKRYPDVRCELDFTSPQELLVATILSAQATDVGVNKATPGLFKRFPTPADYLDATVEDVEPYVKTLNFWRNKAKSVHATMCRPRPPALLKCAPQNGQILCLHSWSASSATSAG